MTAFWETHHHLNDSYDSRHPAPLGLLNSSSAIFVSSTMQVQGLHLPTYWASSDLFFHFWNTTTGLLDFLHQQCFHSQCFNLLKTINPILHTESSVPINLFKTSFILSYTNSKLAWGQFSYSSKAGSEHFLNKTCIYTDHLPLKYVRSFSKYVLDGSYMLDTALGLGDSEMSKTKALSRLLFHSNEWNP